MPITKSRLTKIEQARHLDCLKELRLGGCNVEIPSQPLQNSSALDLMMAGGPESTVVERASGGIGYAILVSMTARRSNVILRECQLENPWDPWIVLESCNRPERLFQVGWPYYPASQLLNDRIENYLRFCHRGEIVEGVIFFSGLKPIPDYYRAQGSAPFKLTFVDQFGKRIGQERELFIEKRHRAVERPSRRALYEPAENPQSNEVVLYPASGEESASEENAQLFPPSSRR